ncbi:hypothetical protein GBA52_011649 [Prunus armeniaca]|nr:hypothetical protein GBA52_011649 [Prunus armeniaca]
MCMTQLIVGLCQLIVVLWRRWNVKYQNIWVVLLRKSWGRSVCLERCDQNLVLDGGNCMRSERHEESSALNGENGMQSEIVSCNAGEREPQNNENGNESLKSKIEGENGARSEIQLSDDDSSDDGDDMDEEENEKGKMKAEVEESDEAGEIEEGEIRDADGGGRRR